MKPKLVAGCGIKKAYLGLSSSAGISKRRKSYAWVLCGEIERANFSVTPLVPSTVSLVPGL